MRNILLIFLMVFGLFMLKACTTKPQDELQRAANVQKQFHADLVALIKSLTTLEAKIQGDSGEQAIQDAFREARSNYKSAEYLSEYLFPMVAKKMNGPALSKVEVEPDEITNAKPNGFQVIEEMIFPYDPSVKKDLLLEVAFLKQLAVDLETNETATVLKDRHVLEAMRLQIVRILSLGISGFDSPVALASLPEAATSLKAMQKALVFYADDLGDEKVSINQAFDKSIQFLEQPSNQFDHFDRLTFIRDALTPLSVALLEAEKVLAFPKNDVLMPLTHDFTSVFTEKAFNPLAFAPNDARDLKPAQVLVGKLLFYDPILSFDGSRTCATCHQNTAERAFTDGLSRAASIDGKPSNLRNTPTLLNVAYQRSAAYDFTALDLEERVAKVLNSAAEMHSSPLEAAQKVRSIPEYADMFEKAFGKAENDEALARQVLVAISQYMRTLNGMNSPFDRYIRGDSNQLDEAAKRGFNLFMGKAKCGTCHFAPLFNGTVPPSYIEMESEVLGVPEKPLKSGATVSKDLGKYELFKNDLHRNAFKTSTVRNAAKTAPYMHNGVYQTLDEVLDFYNRGGGEGIGISLPNQTLPTDELHLSERELLDLKAFIESLTDLSPIPATPTHFPSIPTGSKAIRKTVGIGNTG